MLLSLTSLINSIINNFLEYLSIFLISFFSNTFSAISGGGAGLIQLPALILSGIPYYQALATHKFATVALGIGGSIRNYKSLKNDFHILWQILIFGIPGVIFGASIVEMISEKYFYLVLGIFSVLLALHSLQKSDFGLLSHHKKLNFFVQLRFVALVFLIGILNGSISSGTGLLMTILLIKTFGIDFLRAVSLTFFTVGIFWNAVGAISLTKIGSIPPVLMILLTLGSLVGGFFGAHLSNLKGNKLIKNTFTIVCLSVGISLLIKSIHIFK
tara:strand:- start:31 stop:843 length:813 start_codon:yes stop_codon:yes gene_type:complete